MLRKLSFLLIPFALLFAAACSEDNSSNAKPTIGPTEVATRPDNTEPQTTLESTADGSGGESASASDLFGSFNPFSVLQDLSGGASGSTEVDPSLKSPLLSAADLPDGYVSFGESSGTVPNPEGGSIDMASSMFMSGGFGTAGPMVMSIVVDLPPEARDELSHLSEIQDLSQAELDEIADGGEQFGNVFRNVRALDVSGLGETGGGLHMETDVEGLLGDLGAPGAESTYAQGIALDMYMFLRGERLLMLMLVYPGSAPPGVDGHALAEIMDGRAS